MCVCLCAYIEPGLDMPRGTNGKWKSTFLWVDVGLGTFIVTIQCLHFHCLLFMLASIFLDLLVSGNPISIKEDTHKAKQQPFLFHPVHEVANVFQKIFSYMANSEIYEQWSSLGQASSRILVLLSNDLNQSKLG